MSWVKIAHGFPSHPKVIEAGSRAAYLYVCGLCYANEHLTDGRLPRAVLPALAPGVRDARRLAARLVNAGLWETTSFGWQIHDYEEYQRSADQVRAGLRADRERKRRPESDGKPPGIHAPRARARAGGEEKRREESPPTVPPMGGRQRDQLRFRENVRTYAGEHLPELGEHGARAVEQAIRYGHATNLEQIRSFVAEHFTP